MSKSIRLKDHRAEQELFQQRAMFAGMVMVLALGAVIVRLVWLQVVRYDYYVGESQGNRIKVDAIPANRGLILDRSGLPLATNAPSFQLEVTREQVSDLDRTLAELAALNLVDSTDIPRLRKDIRSRRSFDSVPIKLQLTEEEVARFAARRHSFPGVEIVPRLTRYYPLGSSSVHAIGYVAAISEDDEKNLDMPRYVDVVTAPYGTARSFMSPLPEYKMAGKSGSAQVFTVALNERVRKPGELVEHLRDHALFVAFAPVDAPKIAVAVIVENAPGGGSRIASPIARRILDTYLLTPAQLAEQDAKRKPSTPAALPVDRE